MKKSYLILFFIFLLFSCKNESDLVEVQLPEPEIKTSTTFGNPNNVKTTGGHFRLFKINYPYDALEPAINGETMEIHYSKLYLNYTNALNNFIETNADWKDKSIQEILLKVGDKEVDLKNNAGGYFNHSLYFEILTPKGDKKPTEKLSKAINEDFVSFAIFKNKFINEANKHNGSGWVWLVVTKNDKLEITTSNNEKNPLMYDATVKGTPILCLDLWEHSYYLKHKNNKKAYTEAIFELINWSLVSKKYNNLSTINPQ
ncbi:superoxide dismutase [Flavobacterium sp.]|uniref:superoxide dismutase n=1 Tax=Flavobacterium sp. TaxID=239 RepID=UPI004047D923